MRLALGVEYQGGRYMGWQRQHHGPSVQAELELALSKVADHPVNVVCAGRTDAGVHASGQVVHFDSHAERNRRNWLLGTNAGLPNDISVRWVRRVGDDFHARFSATSRRYVYLLLNRIAPSALAAGRAFLVHRPLDEHAMQAAGQALRGEHDFSAFRAAGCQAKTPRRTVTRLDVSRDGDWLWVDISANAFLQHMVRNITGLLVTIGRGDLAVADAARVLGSRDRGRAPFAAPAHGLYLVSVAYPARFELPLAAAAGTLPLARTVFG
ncbi:MAG: tRNA pseudouridine(38-40) synthase TruA [Pseudomonadota bacterium]